MNDWLLYCIILLSTRFFERYGIAGVCGCIDCTHVSIVQPTSFQERFFNGKHYHSLNVQMVNMHLLKFFCDQRITIQNNKEKHLQNYITLPYILISDL